jgi:EmrB/QacA subfamily drug resistance transporter
MEKHLKIVKYFSSGSGGIPGATLQRTALLLAVMAAFLTPFMGSAVNIALPSIGRQFAMHALTLGWVSTSFILGAAAFLVPMGRIADLCGRKKIFQWGIAVYTITSALCAFAPHASSLIAMRAIQGIGGAMIFGTSVAILTSVSPPERRGRVLGVSVASTYVGLSVGPVVGGLLTQYLGWQSIFLLSSVLGLGTFVYSFRLKGEWSDARGERFDLFGSCMYIAALVALMLSLPRLTSANGLILLFLAIVALSTFGIWEAHTAQPVLHIRMLRENRVFALSNLAALINYSANFATGFLLSLYLQYLKGMSPRQAGLALLAQPVVQAAFSPLAGQLSDRYEPRILASTGMAMSAAGLLSMILLDSDTPLVFIVAALVVLGFGFALFSSPNTNAVMSSVDKSLYGVASGTLGTMRLTGQMLSMGICLFIFSVFIGAIPITPAVHSKFLQSIHVTFLIQASLCVVGIFASVSRGNIH